MPVPVEYKRVLENDLLHTIPRLPFKIRQQEHEKTIEMDIFWVRENQLQEDEVRKNILSMPTCVISYPIEDMESTMLFMNRTLREGIATTIDFQQSDETQSGYVLVEGNTAHEEEFTVSEPGFYSMKFFTNVPTNSSSWLKVIVYDPNDNVMAQKIYYNELIESDDWLEFVIHTWVSDLTGTYKIRFEEFKKVGDNPVGIQIGTNVGGDLLVRSYYYKLASYRGYVREALMQIDVVARDKNKGHEPDPQVFISRKEIADQIADAIRKHVTSTWATLQKGITFVTVEQTPFSMDYMENEYMVDAQTHIRLRYEELTVVEYEVLKEIEVKDIVRL